MRRFFLLVTCLFLYGETPAKADELSKDRMLAELDFIKHAFEVKYAPVEWKKQYANWDLEAAVQAAKETIKSNPTLSIKGFQRILRDFFYTPKDYHVNIFFHSTEFASLPFTVQGANGKYFLDLIDREQLPEHAFPFNVGDEIVRFDESPIQEVVDNIKTNELGNRNPDTDQALAEVFLTLRPGSWGMSVPRGPITISIKPKGSENIRYHQLIWKYVPEKIQNHFAISSIAKNPSNKLWEHFLNKQMLFGGYEAFSRFSPKDSEKLYKIGAKEGFLPDLGIKLWEADEDAPFEAYLCETPSQRLIGYVRIPHYCAGEEEAEAFQHIIEKFEETTDALVIDQLNNPGGSVFYLYALASMLTEQPLYTPRHRMTITQEEVAMAVNALEILEGIESEEEAKEVFGETFGGYPVTYQMAQFMIEFFRFLIEEWNQGKVLTKPYHLFGVDSINPHPSVQYTKPILLLVNSLDFSGGDFFPAILQDNQRATIMGAKTAGAGGYVDACWYPNRFGIHVFSYTGSIAERFDKTPIENLGVTPDIPYQVTEADLKYSYQPYLSHIHRAIESLIED